MDAPEGAARKEDAVVPQSAFARARVPAMIVTFSLIIFVAYYALFFERKLAYYGQRNARVVAGLAEQIRNAIDSTADYARQASTVPVDERPQLFLNGSAQGARAEMPAAVLQTINPCDEPGSMQRTSDWTPNGMLITLRERRGEFPPAVDKSLLADAEQSAIQPSCADPDAVVSASVNLKTLLDPLLRQSSAAVFDSVFLLDAAGRVIYQQAREGTAPARDVTIVRLHEMTEQSLFGKDHPVTMDELLATSRQTAVRVGDDDYELFSAPLRSSVTPTPEAATAKNTAADDTWVVCGIVRQSSFRSQSLGISVTLVSGITAGILLLLLSWPYLKVTLVSPAHRIGKVDVVLLGICGVLGSGILTLTVLDWLTYTRLETIADGQLETLAVHIDQHFQSERQNIGKQLSEAKRWAEQLVVNECVQEVRNGNLLQETTFDHSSYPYIQSFALVDRDGWQRVKWFVDTRVTPMVRVWRRTYFTDARDGKPDESPLAIQSVRSMTTGLPEVDFGSRTDHPQDASPVKDARDALFHEQFPVITMTVPDALSVGKPLLPRYFGFAVIDDDGTVLFHSHSYRNTVENFFAEADGDRRLRALVAARLDETLNIRYWGDDYRARVHPMTGLPWTVITFREKRGLRTLNTEALLATLLFLLVLVGPGILGLVGIVLLVRPRYGANWAWPDPKLVSDYGSLIVIFGVLLLGGSLLTVILRAGTLLLLPFWFVPLVLVITYLHIANPQHSLRLLLPQLVAVVCLSVGAISVRRAELEPLLGSGRANLIVALAGLAIIAILTAVAVRPRAVAPDKPASETEKETEEKEEEKKKKEQIARVRCQSVLPVVYCGAAFLLLVLTSVIPTAAFFKAAYGVEMSSFIKSTQIDAVRQLQQRARRLDEEYSESRGLNKRSVLEDRKKKETRDLYFDVAFGTQQLNDAGKELQSDESPFGSLIEEMIPHYSEASVKTRELIHDRSSDDQHWWTPNGSELTLTVRQTGQKNPYVVVRSTVPTILAGMGGSMEPGSAALATVLLGILLGADYWIARFVARRVFLIDVVDPRWFSVEATWKRHLICYPCTRELAELSKGHEYIKLPGPGEDETEELARLETLPQAFKKQPFEEYVLIDGIDYRFATGKRAELLRGLIERLTRNGDRTVVLCPTKMTVITNGFFQGSESTEWSKTLASFVWIDGNQATPAGRAKAKRSDSGYTKSLKEEAQNETRWERMMRGVANAADSRRTAGETVRRETEHDTYLTGLVEGLKSEAATREQVLDEIGERAENYYTGLWFSCSPSEKIVLLQVAQTGLANEKMRRDVRRLLARGLLRRDPRLGLMNETFRRFVIAQTADTALASQLEPGFLSDTWQRFRIPFFGTVGVFALFFLMTQHELFDATIAAVTGLTAIVPTLAKLMSAWSNRSAAVK